MSKVRPYTGLWLSDGCWPLNPCFPHFQTFYAWQTIYIYLNLTGKPFNLSLFSSKSDHLEIWPPYKRSMTFSYFVLYLNNATSYGYHVISFFTLYNKRNNYMICITTKLKHFEFSKIPMHERGSLIVITWGGLYNTFHMISLEFHNQCITGNLSR